MITPFLIRDVFIALPAGDQAWLNKLVLGLIAIAIATGAIGVLSTYLSNVVGQRVMHDLRSAVYRHLQRLSLAFFTRTRTGEIQSRIANDIGGIQNVVTSTATSIVSNVATVGAAVIAMFLLSWQLAIFSLDPAAVLRAAQPAGRQRAPADHHADAGDAGRHVDARRGIAFRLRDPARQDDGPRQRAGGAVRARVREPGQPRGQVADGRPLGHGLDPDELLDHAGARLLVRRASGTSTTRR